MLCWKHMLLISSEISTLSSIDDGKMNESCVIFAQQVSYLFFIVNHNYYSTIYPLIKTLQWGKKTKTCSMCYDHG